MGHSQRLGGIRNQVSGHQGILHSDMSHGDAVADRNRRNHDRCPACHRDSHLDCFRDLIQIHMPRHDLVVGADHTYQGPLQFFLRISKRVEQGTVGRLLYPLCNGITSHLHILPFIWYIRRSDLPSRRCRSASFPLTWYRWCGSLPSTPAQPPAQWHLPPCPGQRRSAASWLPKVWWL